MIDGHSHLKDVGDAVAVTTGLAVFMQWVPAIAGIVTIIYTVFRLLEALDNRKKNNRWPFAKFGSSGFGDEGETE